MFVPVAYRFAYFPRAAFEKSYSGSISLEPRPLVFLIAIPFLPSGKPRADDANALAVIGMRDHQESALSGQSQSHPAIFRFRVKRITDGHRERIPEYIRRFLERDPVLRTILPRLVGIPLKGDSHWGIVSLPKEAEQGLVVFRRSRIVSVWDSAARRNRRSTRATSEVVGSPTTDRRWGADGSNHFPGGR